VPGTIPFSVILPSIRANYLPYLINSRGNGLCQKYKIKKTNRRESVAIVKARRQLSPLFFRKKRRGILGGQRGKSQMDWILSLWCCHWQYSLALSGLALDGWRSYCVGCVYAICPAYTQYVWRHGRGGHGVCVCFVDYMLHRAASTRRPTRFTGWNAFSSCFCFCLVCWCVYGYVILVCMCVWSHAVNWILPTTTTLAISEAKGAQRK